MVAFPKASTVTTGLSLFDKCMRLGLPLKNSQVFNKIVRRLGNSQQDTMLILNQQQKDLMKELVKSAKADPRAFVGDLFGLPAEDERLAGGVDLCQVEGTNMFPTSLSLDMYQNGLETYEFSTTPYEAVPVAHGINIDWTVPDDKLNGTFFNATALHHVDAMANKPYTDGERSEWHVYFAPIPIFPLPSANC